jgi:hypothetical protein
MNVDMGAAAIIGDTIYIANAVNRSGSACWTSIYKGGINPANPTQITWIAGPAFSQPTCIAGCAALNGNVYWLGGFLNLTTVTNTCWKYEPLTGTISTVVAYPQTIARCNYMVARQSPSANELYVMAGDAGGNWSPPNNYYYKLTGLTSIEEENPNKLPTITALNAPKPNPVANGLTHISFTISEPTKASLKIYDASGRIVKTLVNSKLERGVYNLNWNGIDDHNNAIAEGIYFYTLQTDNQSFTKKLVFTR